MSPEIAQARFVRSAVVELLRAALSRDDAARTCALVLLDSARRADVAGELCDVLGAALALVGGAS